MNLIKHIEDKNYLFISLIFLLFPAFACADQLLPTDNHEIGWSFEPDLGWIYTPYSDDQGTWFWVENNRRLTTRRDGKWIFSAEQYYPFYWDETMKEWNNINRTVLGNIYDVTLEYDTIYNSAFDSIEAYITEAYDVDDSEPHVIHLDFFSNYLSIDIGNHNIGSDYAFIRFYIITGSPLIGDYPFYNPYTEILFADGMKFKKQF